jgi:hypothetical protein
MALPNVRDIPVILHVLVMGTFIVILALILLFVFRFHKALSRHKREKTYTARNRRYTVQEAAPTETEESLIPNSPIMVQYEADDDVECRIVLPCPPPMYASASRPSESRKMSIA